MVEHTNDFFLAYVEEAAYAAGSHISTAFEETKEHDLGEFTAFNATTDTDITIWDKEYVRAANQYAGAGSNRKLTGTKNLTIHPASMQVWCQNSTWITDAVEQYDGENPTDSYYFVGHDLRDTFHVFGAYLTEYKLSGSVDEFVTEDLTFGAYNFERSATPFTGGDRGTTQKEVSTTAALSTALVQIELDDGTGYDELKYEDFELSITRTVANKITGAFYNGDPWLDESAITFGATVYEVEDTGALKALMDAFESSTASLFDLKIIGGVPLSQTLTVTNLLPTAETGERGAIPATPQGKSYRVELEVGGASTMTLT